MNSKERILALINGELPDYTPTGFWLHFPPEQQSWETTLKAHLDLLHETDTDICKVMNEALLRGNKPVENPSDFRTLELTTQAMDNLDREVQLVRCLAKEVDGRAAVLVTVHGALVSAHHASLRKGYYVDNIDFYRRCFHEDREALMSALEQVTEALCGFTRKCMEAGADGIYYALLGAEKDLLTPEEYHTYIEPFDRRILEAASLKDGINVLHLCKKGLDIERFRDYPAQIINWGVYEDNPSLNQGFSIFPDKIILGGLDNHHGPLLEGTEDEIHREVDRLLGQVDRRRFILGADCTLPTDINRNRIRAVAQASRRFSG